MTPDETSRSLIDTVVTYLELTGRPQASSRSLPEGLLIEHVARPSVSFYRELYRRVGDPWLWFERKALDERALERIIAHPEVEIHALLDGRRAVGLAELDFRRPPHAELVYFGVVPDLLGQGIGAPFFERVVELAFARPITRLWLHTCTLDHPRAVAFYTRMGLTVVETVARTVVDPRTQPFWDR